MKHLPFLMGQSEMSSEPSIILKCQSCPQYYKRNLHSTVRHEIEECVELLTFFFLLLLKLLLTGYGHD
jgi:hypothetical protein